MTEASLQTRSSAAVGAPALDIVVLGGGGHVGLPLSLAFADAGLRVGIYDINEATLERIGRGEMPFMESGADELLREVLATGRLELSTDAGDHRPRRRRAPRDRHAGGRVPRARRCACSSAPSTRSRPTLRDGSLVVLRSTVYPGTTEYVAAALADRGKRVDVAFCPERIAEGHALEELHTLPQIIGADTRGCRRPRGGALRAPGVEDPPDHEPRRPSSPSCSRTPGAT